MTTLITLIAPKYQSLDLQERIKLVSEKLDVRISCLVDLNELLVVLANKDFDDDLIGIDSTVINSTNGIDAWNLIQTITTVIKAGGKKSKLMLGADVNTDPGIIKSFINQTDLCLGVWPYGPLHSLDEKRTALLAFKAGLKYIPPRIHEILRPKKQKLLAKDTTIKLTGRQQQILDIVRTRGASNKVIAKMLNISESTVKLHIGAILKKHNLKNRTQLALFTKT